MKLLLALGALLAPALATAQVPVHLYVHPRLFTLRPSAHLYRSMCDTATALVTKLDSGQIVSATASADYRWALVSNIVSNRSTIELINDTGTILTSWYVRRDDLITLPDEPTVKAATTKRRRK